MSSCDLTPYEIERAKRLAENKQRLAELGLNTPILQPLKSEHTPPAAKREQPKTERGRRKSKLEIEELPRRKSSRLAGLQEEYKGLRYRRSNVENDDRCIIIDFDGNSSDEDSPVRKRRPANLKGGKRGGRARAVVVNKGGRIYDSVNGTSCHQCRQKTLDPKVQCTNLVKYMKLNGEEGLQRCTLMLDELCLNGRYGEDLEAAKASGSWICPKCRGICNCSFCMSKRGSLPTGQLKRTALELGYSGVSEYLAATGKLVPKAKRGRGSSQPTPKKSDETKNTEEQGLSE
ncbi:zinc-finger domain of monoamine-oxidase A repressor R1-domain-containing protein [Zopfochytrium polystomum]|nr:zinc-finger domain of monoamine-oxidase A repressor R1-domain-containing protein [Zopfochytrium polystomum]